MANQIIIDIGAVANDGTGDPLRTAFNYVNDNFSNVWASGVANSNIGFSGNKILTTNTNGNLILAPNGIGKVQSNVDIRPNANNTLSLGTSDLRWNSVYTQNLDVGGNVSFNNVTVGGNLTVQGNIIQVGNIVTETLTIQLANAAVTANSANGSGITVGANDNIATLLYNSSSNVWTTNIGITASGNVAGTYFIGNGSQLTGISSYSNTNATSLLAAFGSNSISTTGNITANYFLGNIEGLNGNISGLTATNLDVVNISARDSSGVNIGAGGYNNLLVLPDEVLIQNVPLTVAGNILSTVAGGLKITANTVANGVAQTWNFGTDGNLVIPGEIQGIESTAGGVANIRGGFGTDGPGGDVYIVGGASGNGSSEFGNVIVAAGVGAWTFDNTGKLTFPGTPRIDTDANNFEVQAAENISFEANAVVNIYTDTSGSAYQWQFDDTGNLNLPNNGSINFNAGSIVQAVDEDFRILVQDADDDGYGLLQQVDDGAGNVLGSTELQRDSFSIQFAGGGAPQFRFNEDGVTQLPGNVRWDTYVDQSLFQVSDNNGDGSLELKVISYASDTLGSNVRVTQSNATISTGNAQHTWLFDNTGNLTAPGNIVTTGNITGGNIVSNTVVSNGSGNITVTGNLIPTANTYTLGTEADPWQSAYFGPQSITIADSTGNVANAVVIENEAGNVTMAAAGFEIQTLDTSAPIFRIAALTGQIYSNAQTIIENATDAANITSGSLQTAGGASIAKNLYVGNNIVATGNISANYFVGNGSLLTGLTTTANLTANVITFNTSAGISVDTGQMAWNSADGTVDIGLGYSDVVLQVGQETHYVVRNATGNTILNGTSVYCSGVTAGSGRMEATPYTANGTISPVQYLGLATMDISNGVNGVITYFGYVRGLDTRGTANTAISVGDETWAEGDKLYAHPTAAGKLTKVEPTAPNDKICVCVVITRHQNTGVLFVRPTTNLDITDHSDVQITTPAANEFLTYTGNRWENTALDISVDTSPTLGGNLAGAGFDISNVGNITANNVAANNNDGTGQNIKVGDDTWLGDINISNTLSIRGQQDGANAYIVFGNASNVALGRAGTGPLTYGGDFSVSGNITGNTAGYAIGYRDIPQVSFTGNATIATTDAGKHFYSTQSSNYTLTIANNASQGFQVGAAITVVNQGTGTISIAQGSGVTLYLAGNATAGNRSVATFGMATIIKVATDTWFINGTGVS